MGMGAERLAQQWSKSAVPQGPDPCPEQACCIHPMHAGTPHPASHLLCALQDVDQRMGEPHVALQEQRLGLGAAGAQQVGVVGVQQALHLLVLLRHVVQLQVHGVAPQHTKAALLQPLLQAVRDDVVRALARLPGQVVAHEAGQGGGVLVAQHLALVVLEERPAQGLEGASSMKMMGEGSGRGS